ncbi:hypothetical protein LVD15_13945 [Fulvivirga maritima]|uniref:hypothetical protein n=1 Tax=Fulvivirga maritima TaxID=2904247 RepID=UPI001F412CDB|nr:hypothetical protein [Fulvivirga maritima]UII24424.1 hypothetical protein LVD15_13945 [Fulvivirga maritima]
MDLDRIEHLLAKYWECETSLEEEDELKEFFTHQPVPEHLKSVASLFQYYEAEGEKDELGAEFDELILAELENKKSGKGKVIKWVNDALKVAAVLVILATAGYFMQKEYQDKKENLEPYVTGTFEDPEKAFEETKKALMLISKNMNVGKKQVEKVGVLHEAQKKVKETETL